MSRKTSFAILLAAAWILGAATGAFAQAYGTDLHNTLAPASGGMAGVSLALPQDMPSAVFGNPSTLAQFRGTQFTIAGAWVEPTYIVEHDGFLTGGTPFRLKSGMQGLPGLDIAVAQDLRPLGFPGTAGLGVATLAGAGAEYRGDAPVGGNVSGEMLILGINAALGVDLTPRLAAGAAFTLGTGFFDLALVDASAMVHDYAIRGTFGFDYDLTCCTTVGVFYQTQLRLSYDNMLFRPVPGDYVDIDVDQPDNIGFGVANRSLCCGDLLLAADVLYKPWSSCNLYSDVFVDQWAFAFGAQLTRCKWKYRAGYSYNTNPVDHSVGDSLEGLPIGQAAVEYLIAAQLAAINQHRISAGIGRQDVLPGLDLDLFAGGMLNASDQFGTHSAAEVAIWYIGLGLTWRFNQNSI